MELKRWDNGATVHSGDFGTKKALVEDAVKKRADLQGAYLRGADLQGADLQGADLQGAYLQGAVIEFRQWPARTLPSMSLGELPDALTLELMRRDAWAAPADKRDLFRVWASGGECPLNAGIERRWMFRENADLLREYLETTPLADNDVWRPQMNDADLVLEICKAKGWGIAGYLETPKKETA